MSARADPRCAVIDAAALAAQSRYNATKYLVRQAVIFAQRYLGAAALFPLLKRHEASTALPPGRAKSPMTSCTRLRRTGGPSLPPVKRSGKTQARSEAARASPHTSTKPRGDSC